MEYDWPVRRQYSVVTVCRLLDFGVVASIGDLSVYAALDRWWLDAWWCEGIITTIWGMILSGGGGNLAAVFFIVVVRSLGLVVYHEPSIRGHRSVGVANPLVANHAGCGPVAVH